jgi:hypothetical protein
VGEDELAGAMVIASVVHLGCTSHQHRRIWICIALHGRGEEPAEAEGIRIGIQLAMTQTLVVSTSRGPIRVAITVGTSTDGSQRWPDSSQAQKSSLLELSCVG